MKKTIGKNRRNIKLLLLLFGIFAAVNIEIKAQTSQCDAVSVQTVTRVSTAYLDTQSGAWGYSRYDIRRNGSTNHYIHVFYDVPDDTVFKAVLNGVEVGTLTRHNSTIYGEYWMYDAYDGAAPVGHVGDVMTVTKNGVAFVTGTYTREPHDYEAADGFDEHVGTQFPCTIYRGQVFLPTSANPRTLRSAVMGAFAPSPITRITINEPSQTPGVPGPEIAEIPMSSMIPIGTWYWARIVRTDTVLTETQFSLLRQGLISVTTYTAQHPNGYAHVPLVTQGINQGTDFEGDGIADLAVFRPSEQNWYLQLSSTNQTETVNFGSANDKLVVGDYDSDNRADIASFQKDNPVFPDRGVWQILRSSDDVVQTVQWGLNDDIPLAVNIDINNSTDMGVFRPSNGTWYIKRTGDIIKPLAYAEFGGQNYVTFRWGTAGDKPLAGDFNADGIDELVAFRPSEGNWYIYDAAHSSYQILHWGLSTDIPMTRDFDGDRKVDLAVYRPSEGNWYIYSSLDNKLLVYRFGLNGDVPVPADFDKDSVADIAVFRPSNGTWYVMRSSNNSFFAAQFGLNGDIPTPAR